MRSIGPAVTREQSPACLRNSNGRLDFPGPTQEASRIPRRNSRIPPQLQKNHVVPPSSQEDRKSTRLNSSHHSISYAVFCLKKKNQPVTQRPPQPHARRDPPPKAPLHPG